MELNILEYEFYPNLKEYALNLFNIIKSLNYHNIYKYMFQIIYLLKFGELITYPNFSLFSKFDLFIIFFEDYKYKNEIIKLCDKKKLNNFLFSISATKWNYNNITIDDKLENDSDEDFTEFFETSDESDDY